MRSIARRLVLTAIVGCLVVACSARDNRNVIAAQQRAPVTVTRIYTGPDGQTHAEEIDVKLTPAVRFGGEQSVTFKATGAQFTRWPPGLVADWHPALQRQYVITLSGRAEVELVGGKKIPLEPGRILLAEDLTGKGHISRVLGTQDWVFLLVRLAEQ